MLTHILFDGKKEHSGAVRLFVLSSCCYLNFLRVRVAPLKIQNGGAKKGLSLSPSCGYRNFRRAFACLKISNRCAQMGLSLSPSCCYRNFLRVRVAPLKISNSCANTRSLHPPRAALPRVAPCDAASLRAAVSYDKKNKIVPVRRRGGMETV